MIYSAKEVKYRLDSFQSSRVQYSGSIWEQTHTQSHSSVQPFPTPQTVACQILCLWYFPCKNTGKGYHVLRQGIFPSRGSNPCLLCLLYCWQMFTTEPSGKPQEYGQGLLFAFREQCQGMVNELQYAKQSHTTKNCGS